MNIHTILSNHIVRKVIGAILIGCVVVIWVGSSEVIQLIFKAQFFEKPLYLTYYNTGLFSLYLLGFLFIPPWTKSLFTMFRNMRASTRRSVRKVTEPIDKEELKKLPVRYNVPDTMLTSLGLCPLWFIANITFNYSLSLTSVTSSTIISNTSSLFTFILGLLIRIDSFSFMRVFAIGLSIGGVVLVTVFDKSNVSGSTKVGNMLTLFSAFMYGTYTTYLKKRCPDSGEPVVYEEIGSETTIAIEPEQIPAEYTTEDQEATYYQPVSNRRFIVQTSMPMVFGFVGLFNILMLWPFLIILHYTGVEPYEVPKWKVFLSLTANGLVGTMLSDLLWALSVVFTSAVVSTLGLAMTIPLSFAADMIIHKKIKFTPAYICGSLMVICSFLIANLSYYLPQKVKNIDSPDFKSLLHAIINRFRKSQPSKDLENKLLENEFSNGQEEPLSE